MKKTMTLMLLLCFSIIASYADQILIYKTFNDYQNNTPTILEGEVEGFPDMQLNSTYHSGFTVKTKEKKERFFAEEIWGFKFKDVLFRTFKFFLKQQKNGLPSFGFMALVSQGKICYWENGLAIIDILNSDKDPRKGYIKDLACNGYFGLSKSIESDIHTGRFNNFFSQNPEYKDMPAEFRNAVINHPDCAGSLKKVNLKASDKLFDLGGVDDIAFMNFLGGVNNNAGKTMGFSAAIFLIKRDGDKNDYVRDYFKNYNNGNFNSIIYKSVFRYY